MHYQLIGIDLDGTLLDGGGRVSEANRRAIADAQAAGATIVPCTGRGWREAHRPLQAVEGLELGVFITGAAVCRIDTGHSVDLSVLEPHLALELARFLEQEPYAVLVYQEANMAGQDYLVTGRGQLSRNTEWWFQLTGATARFQRTITVQDMRHVLRVGLVAPAHRQPEIAHRIGQAFGEQVLLHHFQVLAEPDDEPEHVLEIFAAGTDKWRGLEWIAHQRSIPHQRIATIGDQVNDLPMLQQAGCGVAMGNAIDDAKARAHHLTRPNHADGVAHALNMFLAGQW